MIELVRVIGRPAFTEKDEQVTYFCLWLFVLVLKMNYRGIDYFCSLYVFAQIYCDSFV